MKKILLLILLAFTFSISYSSHFKGADIRLVNLKNGQGQPSNIYKFVIKYYASSQNSFSTQISIKTRLKFAGNVINTFGCLRTTNPQQISYTNTSCNTYLPNVNVYVAEYESTPYDMSSYDELDNYYVNFEDIPNGVYLNINFNGNQYEHYTEFPRLNASSPYKFNSSPVFTNHPLYFTCINNPVSLDYSAVDPDGDSLVYSLVIPPATGLTKNSFMPTYGLNNYIKGNPALSINSKTGIAILNPNIMGNYYIAVKVEEYRNGQKIGEVTRQHELTVISGCSATYTDQKPIYFFAGDTTRKTMNLSVNSVGNSLEFFFNAFDAGNIKDSLFISIKPDYQSSKNFSQIDTSKYNWQIFDSTSYKNIGKYDFEVAAKKNIQLKFKINYFPALFDSLSGTYSFFIYIRDSKCLVSHLDSTGVSISFTKNPSIDTINSQYAKKGSTAEFKAIGTNLNNVTYQWQTDLGFGFQNLIENNTYENIFSQTLKVKNVQLKNHEQLFRCIVKLGNYADTSDASKLYILDSTVVYVFDTVQVSVSDTLIIKLLPMTVPPVDVNIVKVYPNPTTGKLYINAHPSNQLQNFQYDIVNPLGQIIFSDNFNKAMTEIDLYQWALKGLYHFNIYETSTGKLVESKKIVLE